MLVASCDVKLHKLLSYYLRKQYDATGEGQHFDIIYSSSNMLLDLLLPISGYEFELQPF